MKTFEEALAQSIVQKEWEAAREELVAAHEKIAKVMGEWHEAKARVGKLETLLRNNAVQWLKEVAESLAPPPFAGVRVFYHANSSTYWAVLNEKIWRLKSQDTEWKLYSTQWGNGADAYVRMFTSERELIPAEVAELNAQYPLPATACYFTPTCANKSKDPIWMYLESLTRLLNQADHK